jgi:hypothetical protein
MSRMLGVSEAELDELMYRHLFGVGLMRFSKLERQGLISDECRRHVVAALLVRLRKTAAQAQALMGDHLYVIGPPRPARSSRSAGRSTSMSG